VSGAGGADHDGDERSLLRVSTRSSPNAVAGAMAGVVRQHGGVEVQVVGAGALNQAVKALAIARGFLEEDQVDLVCVPSFADVEIDGEMRTAIRLWIDDRDRRRPGADIDLLALERRHRDERGPAHGAAPVGLRPGTGAERSPR
jgi:stage V sporulation protein S